MGYRILADATVTVHCSFVLFLLTGGYLALRWRRVFPAHVAAVVWIILLSLGLPITCPLTSIENWARERGGEPGIPQGFIDAHLTGVLYPASLEWLFKVLVTLAIAGSWFLVGRQRVLRSRRLRSAAQSPAL